MTAKEYNEKVLSNREIVELADAMGLGEVATVSFKESKTAGPYRIYTFDNGRITAFSNRVIASCRKGEHSIEVCADSAEVAMKHAIALGVAAYVATLHA